MCLPTPPALRPLPTPPSANDEATRQREAVERQRLAAASGTAGNVRTDLSPSQVTGQRRVLLGV